MRRSLLAIVLSIAVLPAAVNAEPQPLWEFGLGPTLLRMVDYRGADESRVYIYPFPYIIYRGDVFRADRDGIRGIFFESDRVEFDVSVFGTVPVDSEENDARQGMPDLDPTIEIGPRINVTLARDRTKDWRLDLRLPVRAAVATDLSHAQSIGWVAYPHINLDLHPTFLGGKWNIGLQTGPIFATAKYHQYFYGVDPQFATPARPAYEASGGYSGTAALGSLTRRFGRFWVGAFVRYDYLKDAVFDDSPLVKRDHSFNAGIAVAWVFAESQRKVDVDD